MEKIPGIHKQPEPDIPQDAPSNSPKDIVANLTDEQLEDAWEAETSIWQQMGIHPGQNIQIDQFLFKSRLEVLIQILTELELIETESFNVRVQRYMLETMITIRRENEAALEQMRLQMLQAKLTEGINPKGVFLPPGVRLDGN